MLHDPALLDALEGFDTARWQGRVFRHMLGSAAPELVNERGARWNPPGTAALYTSLAEATAKAEGDHLIGLGLLVPSVRDDAGSNLVIFTANQPAEAEIQVRGQRRV